MTESVKIEKSDFTTCYRGSGAALVQAGLVRSDQLPGPNGPRKRSAVYYDGEPASRGRAFPRDERYMKVTLLARDEFEVLVPHSRDECERVDLHLQADLAARCAAADARALAISQLASLPDSREAYKSKVVADLEHHLEYAVSLLQASHRHGYRFDERALQQVMAAASQLRAAVQGGRVVFDARRHDLALTELSDRAGLARGRPKLSLVPTAGCE